MKKLWGLLALFLALVLTVRVWIQRESSSSGSSAQTGNIGSGAARYDMLCASCHGAEGLAVEGEAPPLAGSSWVSGSETRLIKIVLHGVRGPIQVGNLIHDREMLSFGPTLSDEEIASLLSYVRSRWGGSKSPTTPETVRRVRAADADRTRYWTVEELLAVP